MVRKFLPTRVRTRLTLWYLFVLASVLVLSWSLTAAFLFFQMRSQLDHYAVQDIETVEGLLYFDAGGRLLLNEDYHNHPESKQVLERYLEVRSADGGVLYRNGRLAGQALGGRPIPSEGRNQYSNHAARLADGTPVWMVSRRHVLAGHPVLIRLAYSLRPIWARFEEFGVASLLALPIVLVLAGIAGYLLTRSALAPLQKMAGRAERITSQSLHERLPVGQAGDELDHLARVFNDLLARLEQSFDQLRRFTSDASHELRTPLASIRSVGEVALQKNGNREEFRDTIGSMLEEVNRLTALVDSLLTISRADAGRIQLHPTVFPAMGLAREAAGLFEILAEEKGLRIAIEGDEGVSLTGDRMFLRQALVNIIHNAVKYSPPGGLVSVSVLDAPAGSIRLEVADTGPGIAPEHFARIFDRFYRVDESRSREFGGAGLGLSIAQWAVRAHGGEIRLLPAPGKGCTFQIWLPSSVSHTSR
ncbi:MAG TPA: ATP-binding protein [Bryobacteraceae bacterium]|nr:ATP-binding protein [Bryobacteraceae bacterium]